MKNEKTKQKQLISDLQKINYLEGYYNAKWDDEYNREDYVYEYLDKMQQFANEYHIDYDNNLENYIVEDESEPEYCTVDNMAYELKQKVEQCLINKLIYYMGGYNEYFKLCEE